MEKILLAVTFFCLGSIFSYVLLGQQVSDTENKLVVFQNQYMEFSRVSDQTVYPLLELSTEMSDCIENGTCEKDNQYKDRIDSFQKEYIGSRPQI